MNKGMYTSNNKEWETPQWLFDELDKEFERQINIDVCATKKNAKCHVYFTKKDNGLIIPWIIYASKMRSICWMNPPYGKEIGKWIKKAYEESLRGVMTIALLPARTDTKWFHNYIYNKAEIRFLKGRLKFSNSKNSAPFPSMIVIWNNNL